MSNHFMETVEADIGKIVGKAMLEWPSPCYDMGGMGDRVSVTLKLFGDCELNNLRVRLPDGRTLMFPRLSVVKIQLEGLALPAAVDGSLSEEYYHVEPPPVPVYVSPPPRAPRREDDSDPF